MKEDTSSPTISTEAVVLMCIVDANENRDVTIVDIPNAFVQTVVEDKKDRAFIPIRGPLVNSLTAMGAHERPLFNKLCGTVVSCQIFIHSQSLIAR